MKATQYIVNTCIVDSEDTIHVILVSDERKAFVPLYLDFESCQGLLDFFSGETVVESELTWKFISDSWQKLWFEVVSIIIDFQGAKGYLIPTVTLLQNQFDQKNIYVTCFAPMNVAVAVAVHLGTPLFLTERAENKVKKIGLSLLNDYIDDVSVKQEE